MYFFSQSHHGVPQVGLSVRLLVREGGYGAVLLLAEEMQATAALQGLADLLALQVRAELS